MHVPVRLGYTDYKLFLQYAAKITPPKGTDIKSFTLVATTNANRNDSPPQHKFDVVEVLTDVAEGLTKFQMVMAICTLQRKVQVGIYSNRTRKYKTTTLDTFLITADMLQFQPGNCLKFLTL